MIEFLDIKTIPEIILKECLNCGHCYSSHQLNEELIDKYYRILNSEYFGIGIIEPRDYESYLISEPVTLLQKFKKSGRILDVGCGYGFLLDKFRTSGWTTFGVEPSPYASDYAKNRLKIDIISEYLTDDLETEDFDVIMMMDVLEHISNPNKLLTTTHKYLKSDGNLMIATGNVNSLNAILTRGKWPYFGSYEHISFYNIASIKYLLDKNGFSLLGYWHTAYDSGYIRNILRLPKNLFFMFNDYIRGGDKPLALALDHLIIIASKK
ncbi:MAG: class I SAM-dependent methyltransferase [Ignavibacteriaceae bacterium]|jgi:SAM-dependent methyltransferase|nr:class I SAM-dependent methyltransferase [Ignavibacteriaceae bacterium]